MNQRNKTVTPAIPLIFLSDASGEQVFGSAADQFHTWDTVVLKTSDFHYTVDDDRIIINRRSAGFYEITFEVSWKTVETLRQIWTDVFVNGVNLTNSHTHTFVAGSGGQPTYRDQHVIHYIIYLNPGDYIQLASRGNSTNVTTDPKSSRLIIKFIPLKGWNNDTGGKVRSKGGFI